MTGVTIRMYRGLLGDCFLLRLFNDKAGDRTRQADAHVLIDCGILQQVKRETARIRAVAEDIRITCDQHLDLVVVTHEHHDHLCGFGHAADIFLDEAAKGEKPANITIDELWLGWTEKADPQADALRDGFKQARLAVSRATQRMRMKRDVDTDDDWHSDGALGGLEAFIGPLDGLGVKGRRTGREILRDLQARAGKTVCHEPGTVAKLPGAVPLRTYVLGPPRDPLLLMMDMPSTGNDKQTYLRVQRECASAFAAAEHTIGFGNADGDEALPFGPRHNRLNDRDVLERLAPAGPDDPHVALRGVRDRYLAEPSRRIDTDWEAPVGALALKLDSATNNTSLVLAFELEPGGDVLLFAADAQVGNWLSWHAHRFDDGLGGKLTAKQLLARTVLYKVGHHGSHNATLKDEGLELMTHADLVAMIPVVEAEAQLRVGWHMPFAAMYAALEAKTGGRILRGDKPIPTGVTFPGRHREGPQTTVGPDAAMAPLWVEYDVC